MKPLNLRFPTKQIPEESFLLAVCNPASSWPLHDIVLTNIVWYIVYKREVGRRFVYCNNRAILLHQGGQCRWAGGYKDGCFVHDSLKVNEYLVEAKPPQLIDGPPAGKNKTKKRVNPNTNSILCTNYLLYFAPPPLHFAHTQYRAHIHTHTYICVCIYIYTYIYK